MLTDEKNNDATKLVYLLDQFNFILTKIIENKSLFRNERIYSMIKELWDKELKTKNFLPSLADVLLTGKYAKELEAVGLFGPQLTLKFNIFNNFFLGEMVDESAIKLRSTKPFTLGKRIIAAFFDFFNSFLGSLGIAIPIAEALKEFKDMVHFEINYGNELSEKFL